MESVKPPVKGVPKWDVMVKVSIGRETGIKGFKLSKAFIKRLIEQLKIKL